MSRHQGFFDGGSRGNPGVAGAGWFLEQGKGVIIDAGTEFVGLRETNNTSEYKGVIGLLRCALENDVSELTVYGDSKLVIMQVQGEWACRKTHLRPLCHEAKTLIDQFDVCTLEHVPRKENTVADRLSNIAMDTRKSQRGPGLVHGRGEITTIPRQSPKVVSPERTIHPGGTEVVRIRRQGGEVVQDCDVWVGGDWDKGGWSLERSKWYNPISTRLAGSPRKALQMYKGYLRDHQHLLQDIHELKGKRLGCFCALGDPNCHAAYLAMLAENPDAVQKLLDN